eukprot:TRINITY_DN5512_c0_g1_i1.p1 TRINITY_DN5512_c0_g1~~TRINITY_DN5512_c0_g1_i1.p1  ORF type:complete len:601 (+),score=238.05 TRINITY_DN5512_c0_g1_i1:39-1805(+)
MLARLSGSAPQSPSNKTTLKREEFELERSYSIEDTLDIDPQLRDLMSGELNSLVIPFHRLEQVITNFSLEGDASHFASKLKEISKSNANWGIIFGYEELLYQSQLKISLCLAFIAQYRTVGTMKSLWNFLTADYSTLDFPYRSSLLKKELEETIDLILDSWGKLGIHSDNFNHSSKILKEEERNEEKEEILMGYLLIDDKMQFGIYKDRKLYYKVMELLDKIDLKKVMEEIEEEESTYSVINIEEIRRLEEETKGSYAHTLTFEDNNGKVTKVLIPYSHRPIQKKWIDALITTFIRGRTNYMTKEEHLGHESIQENALEAICKFGNLSKPVRVDLVKKGAIQGILGPMRAFEKNYNVQYWGLGAINNFTLKVDYSKMVAGRGGVVEILLNAMKNFGDDIPLQIRACLTMQSLAYGVEYNKVVIINSGGIEVIANILARFRRDQELQMVALGCLSNLSSSDEHTHILKCKAIDSISKSMLFFPDNFNIQFYAIGALVNLSQNEATKKAVISPEIVMVTVTAMRTFHDNELLIHRGLCYIQAILMDEDGRDLVFNEAGANFLNKVSRAFPSSAKIQELIEVSTPLFFRLS